MDQLGGCGDIDEVSRKVSTDLGGMEHDPRSDSLASGGDEVESHIADRWWRLCRDLTDPCLDPGEDLLV